MQTEVVKLDSNKPDITKIKEAAAIVDAGGFVAFPTETVYGIACRVNTRSLSKLSKLKGRVLRDAIRCISAQKVMSKNMCLLLE